MIDPYPTYQAPWYSVHLPPGTSAVVLAFLAFVPWILENTKYSSRRKTKRAAIPLICLLLASELWSIRWDGVQRQKDQEQILFEQRAALTTTKENLKTTQENLTTTKRVASLAVESLENITGGSSFAYVIPTNSAKSELDPKITRYSLTIVNDGDRILAGVTVTVQQSQYKYTSEGEVLKVPTSKTTSPVTLGKHESEIINDPDPSLRLDPQKFVGDQGTYLIIVSAQNGSVREDLHFRRHEPDANGWEYSLSVSKQVQGKRITLKHITWIRVQ
jgi:hypothetical protein